MKVHVGNLSKQVTDSQLNDLAVPYGNVVSATIVTDRVGGQSKGFGFIEFSTADEGNAAITGLNGREIDGQALKVSEARPRNSDAPRA